MEPLDAVFKAISEVNRAILRIYRDIEESDRSPGRMLKKMIVDTDFIAAILYDDRDAIEDKINEYL